MEKQIKDLTELELAQEVGATYRNMIQAQNWHEQHLLELNAEIQKRQPKTLTENNSDGT